MFDLHPVILNAFIGLIGVLLLVFAWRSVSSLPALARWSLRLILSAIIIAPFALIILATQNEMARAPMQQEATAPSATESAGSGTAAPRPKKVQPKITAPVGDGAAPDRQQTDRDTVTAERRDDSAASGSAAPTAPPVAAPDSIPDVSAPRAPEGGWGTSGPGPGGGGTGNGSLGMGTRGGGGLGAGGTTRNVELPPTRGLGGRAPASANGGDDKAASESARAPEPAPADRERSAEGASSSPAAAANGDSDKSVSEPSPGVRESTAEAAAPAGAVGEEKEDWTIVPVYYGTDRARVPNDKRVDYGADRGRRLELGRAMVSVPKAHQVPQVERPWAITIPYFNYKIYEQKEDPKKHFIIQEIKDYSEADLLKLVKERLARSARYKDHAFVFVHGYNTSFDYAVYRAAQIAYDIKFDGAPFVYSWPSGGGIASYTYDRESSAQAEPYFTDFLKMVTQKSGAKHVSIIAHSMGNQLVLRVLQDLQRTRPEGVEISQIIFAAPDVDRDTFETIASQLKDFATGGITLYAAANDRALSVSRRFYGGVPRAGDVPESGPLIVPGIDTIDATAVSMDSLGLHHSGYAESNKLLHDIGKLIETGQRPPNKREPTLQEVTTAKGDYWRYPGSP